MKKIVFWVVAALFCPLILLAQSDTTKQQSPPSFIEKLKLEKQTSPYGNYNPSRGYFQKAFVDTDDPRFMIADEKDNFRFGIGGYVHAFSFYDINSTNANPDFNTAMITIPKMQIPSRCYFGVNAGINLKATGKIGDKQIVAVIDGGFSSATNTMRLSKAYLSYNGISFGKIYSAIMDLEASPPTIDRNGPGSQLAVALPAIRYSGVIGKHWSYTAALEYAKVLAQTDTVYKVRNDDYQILPDLLFHFKYKNKFGHIQLGGIVRDINYYSSIKKSTQHEIGYGVSLSGKIKFLKNHFIYFQTMYGKGIEYYVNDLSSDNYDLIPDVSTQGKMITLPAYGGFIALVDQWTKKLYTSLVYGYTHLQVDKANIKPLLNHTYNNMFNYTHYLSVSLFWDFIPFAEAGIGYSIGQRVNYPKDDNTPYKGTAQRIDLSVRYSF